MNLGEVYSDDSILHILGSKTPRSMVGARGLHDKSLVLTLKALVLFSD